ncbi:hypothetical protein [Parasitella parasitica]|uniref:Uncharacterized protein n=1 Tax=Parasitella parasitica TaxID=35722 RepID=A0A0B7NL34_9FUNG|nr:hypothetical protein [Parasitella parasitica]
MEQQNQQNELPKHMPIDMALAPDQTPYEHTHVIHTTKASQNENNRLAQHSLSPEKLGLVGYVKDVAGFVKDVVHERREQRARRSSTSSITSTSDKPLIEQEAATTGEEKQRRRSSAEHVIQQHQHQQEQQQPTRLAGAVTGLFPGVGNSNENAAGCTHADDLRDQMRQINSEDNRKLL